jgi:hypothetical protein
MINREEFIRVVKEIENAEQNHPKKFFDMTVFYSEDVNGPECGTAMCLAGWTCYVNGIDIRAQQWGANEIFESAKNALGLSHAQALGIFLETRILNVSQLKSHVEAVTGEKLWNE